MNLLVVHNILSVKVADKDKSKQHVVQQLGIIDKILQLPAFTYLFGSKWTLSQKFCLLYYE